MILVLLAGFMLTTSVVKDNTLAQPIGKSDVICADGTAPDAEGNCADGSNPRPASSVMIPNASQSTEVANNISTAEMPQLVCNDGTVPDANGKCTDGSTPHPAEGSTVPGLEDNITAYSATSTFDQSGKPLKGQGPGK